MAFGLNGLNEPKKGPFMSSGDEGSGPSQWSTNQSAVDGGNSHPAADLSDFAKGQEDDQTQTSGGRESMVDGQDRVPPRKGDPNAGMGSQ